MDSDNQPNKVVLIVEDEHDNREIMRAVVEDLLGYKALLAHNGAAAIQVATAEQPAVILMDLMMPVLDGFEAMRHLKAQPTTAHIPIVAVTALGRPSDRQKALNEGADGYLSKPFDLDALVAIIQLYITTSEQQAVRSDQ